MCWLHVLQRLLCLFCEHVVLSRPRAEAGSVQLSAALQAALLVPGEETKPGREKTEDRGQSVSVSQEETRVKYWNDSAKNSVIYF